MSPPMGAARAGIAGAKVSEIPDSGSLHARYDATELSLSDGNSVSAWGDETGSGHDLSQGTASAQPTFQTGVINGNPVVRFDGADDYLDVAFSALPQPNTIFVVCRFRSIDSGAGEAIYDSDDSDLSNQHLYRQNQGDWQAYAGSSLNDGAADTNWHIHSTLWNGGNSTMRIDGTQVASGGVGSLSLPGFTLGAAPHDSSHAPIDVGEVLIYPSDKSGIQSDVESYLSGKWGVTL